MDFYSYTQLLTSSFSNDLQNKKHKKLRNRIKNTLLRHIKKGKERVLLQGVNRDIRVNLSNNSSLKNCKRACGNVSDSTLFPFMLCELLYGNEKTNKINLLHKHH